MASKTILTDDLGGEGAATTVEFAFKGVKYTIDLNDENLHDFELELKQYIDNGRVKGGTSTRRPVEESNAIRTWAAENGFEVAPKGRIPQAVLVAYEGAQAPSEAPEPVAEKTPAKRATTTTKKAGA